MKHLLNEMEIKLPFIAVLGACAALLAAPATASDMKKTAQTYSTPSSSTALPSPNTDSTDPGADVSGTAADWARGQIERYEPEQETLSQTITQTAVWLDSFFNTDRNIDEENTTRFRLGYEQSFEDGSGFDVALNLDLRLMLPSVERRWGIYLNSLGEDLKPRDSELAASRGSVSPVEKEKGFETGLRYVLSQTDWLHASGFGGLRFHGVRPETYLGVRTRQARPNEWGAISFAQRIIWFQDTAFEANATVDFDYKVTDTSMIRFSPQVSGYSSVAMPGVYYGAPINYFIRLSDNDAIDYQAFIWLSTSPNNHIDDQGGRVVYRRRLYKSWIFGESAVWVRFPKEREYQQTAGILFKLDTYFGDTREFAAKDTEGK